MTRATAVEAVVRAVLAQPGLSTAAYVRVCDGHRASAVKMALHRLHGRGLVRQTPQQGVRGKGQTLAVCWWPTPVLTWQQQRGIPVRAGRGGRVDDEEWTPPTPYVHPIRARALGLTRAA